MSPPDPKQSAWYGDWHGRVWVRIRDAGFDSPEAFFQANPKISFTKLAASLGGDVAPVQLQNIHRESRFPGGSRAAALDCLVRLLLEHFKHAAWGEGRYFATNAISAFVFWVGVWEQSETKAIQEAFLKSPPPIGWRPTGVDDEYLNRIFEVHWPE